MKNKIWLLLFFTGQSFFVYSQSVLSSPYSVFGLGSLYESDFGSIPSIGSSGIALPSSSFINNKNPASLALINKHSFFFDIGINGVQTTISDQYTSEKRNNFQFSHAAIGFPITSKSGVSISLKPYSSATYQISNFAIPIANSEEEYYLDALSTGGINSFDLSYGYKIHKSITLGLSSSFYFGNINEEKNISIADSETDLTIKNHYEGLRFTLGNQIKIDSTLSIGLVMKSPTNIAASKTQTVSTVNLNESQDIETDVNYDVNDFNLPLEIGFGFSKLFKKNINLTFDYEKSFWNSTNQTNLYGDFKNQDRFSMGVSYFKKDRSYYYSDRIHYSFGLNYDNGYLSINNQNLTNSSFSLGIGIPIDNTRSLLNITYSYGQKGSIGNDLVKENYHKIGINLSLESIWFVRRKYD